MFTAIDVVVPVIEDFIRQMADVVAGRGCGRGLPFIGGLNANQVSIAVEDGLTVVSNFASSYRKMGTRHRNIQATNDTSPVIDRACRQLSSPVTGIQKRRERDSNPRTSLTRSHH